MLPLMHEYSNGAGSPLYKFFQISFCSWQQIKCHLLKKCHLFGQNVPFQYFSFYLIKEQKILIKLIDINSEMAVYHHVNLKTNFIENVR